jgi:capsular exopolysaccharide synthesis family protein
MNLDQFEDDYEDDFNLKEVLNKYLVHWRWFAICAVVGLLAAFLYLRYTIPQYQATTTILVKDEKKGGMLSELSAFADLGMGKGMVNNVDNEIEILKSRTLVENTIKKLHFNISLTNVAHISDREIYENAPIAVDFGGNKKLVEKASFKLLFTAVSPQTFTLKNDSEKESPKAILIPKKEFRYGESILTPNGTIVINKSKIYGDSLVDKPSLRILVSPIDKVTKNYLKKFTVEPISKTSSVVQISIVDQVPLKAEDFLNTLVQLYNEEAAADKNFISENTSKFISDRLVLITQELDGVEKEVQSFKKDNKLTDIESEAKLFVEGSEEYNKKGVEIEIQLNVVNSLLDFMKKSNYSDLLPGNIIDGQGEANSMISAYNKLVLDRNRILKSATAENPAVVKIDQQLASMKSNVTASLVRLKSSLTIQKRDIDNHEGIINHKVEKIPVQERQFRVIARQQKVKEELYLYLLQKREETAISLSATEPNARVIDDAKSDEIPVSPKKNIIYLAGLLLGLLVPFGFVYTRDLLDTKVKSRMDIEGTIDVPFIGDIPTSDSSPEIIQTDSRSSSAEALRIIRTNLDFMVSKVSEDQAKTIFVTSTFPKEGKTFVSVNLAATFALSGKKVLLIGMDIRNPRLDEYLSLPDRGVTNYLSSKELQLEDLIIQQKGYEDFHVLPAGVIPPNPAELLMNKKVDQLFKTLKTQYDYIIVDTAPVSLVTDTLLIAKYADCFIYVARANVLEKNMLHLPYSLHKDKKLPNMCMLLNDTKTIKGYGYGSYGYGYGVTEAKMPWYQKLLKK